MAVDLPREKETERAATLLHKKMRESRACAVRCCDTLEIPRAVCAWRVALVSCPRSR